MWLRKATTKQIRNESQKRKAYNSFNNWCEPFSILRLTHNKQGEPNGYTITAVHLDD